MARSLKKGPYIHYKLQKKIDVMNDSGKKSDIIEKISKGKIQKFISDNTLLNQIWIMDTKMKVHEVLKKHSNSGVIKILDFVRFKVGEGI